MVVTLSNGKKVDLDSSVFLLDLTEVEYRELILICRMLKHETKVA